MSRCSCRRRGARGGSLLRFFAEKIRPQSFAWNAGYAFNLNEAFGWHSPPIQDSAIFDAKTAGKLDTAAHDRDCCLQSFFHRLRSDALDFFVHPLCDCGYELVARIGIAFAHELSERANISRIDVVPARSRRKIGYVPHVVVAGHGFTSLRLILSGAIRPARRDPRRAPATRRRRRARVGARPSSRALPVVKLPEPLALVIVQRLDNIGRKGDCCLLSDDNSPERCDVGVCVLLARERQA